MNIYELVKFNSQLLQNLQLAGVKIEDWKYIDLYKEYERMVANGLKRTAIVLILADKYKLSERQVYNIIKHLKTPVNL